MDFQNPFSSPFWNNFSSTQNEFAGVNPLSAPYDLTTPPMVYQNPFSRDLKDEDHTICASLADIDQGIELFEPFRLVICRTHLTNVTHLCDPLNLDVIYSVKETFPYSLSPAPDLQVERTISGDVTIGIVKYGILWDQITSTTSGQCRGKINQFEPRHLREAKLGKVLVWRIKQRKAKPKWSSIDGKGFGMRITQPLLMFELVEKSNVDSAPLCRVSMFTTRPVGLIEVFAKSACVNHEGGDWMALDELILSAYANMEQARMQLMSGSSIHTCGPIDKTDASWPGLVLGAMMAPPKRSPIEIEW